MRNKPAHIAAICSECLTLLQLADAIHPNPSGDVWEDLWCCPLCHREYLDAPDLPDFSGAVAELNREVSRLEEILRSIETIVPDRPLPRAEAREEDPPIWQRKLRQYKH